MISLDEWERGGTFSTLEGHRIFCREGGDARAPVLVLIHGFPTASWDYEALWEPLCQRYRVVTLDMLGFGFSDKPMIDYSIMRQADLFEARLAELGITEYHVLAHDYGDTVAQELLARDRPRSVCFLNGGLFPETHRALSVQKLLLSSMGPFAARFIGRTRFDQNLRRVFSPKRPPSDELLDGYWKLLTRGGGAPVMAKLIHYMPERIRHRTRWVGALQQASAPLKLIDGVDDPVSGRHMATRYCELVPSPNVSLLEGVGHYPQVEAPQAVLDAYLQFRGE